MCRWLGMISVRASSVYAPLLETDKSLWRQSFRREDQRQEDGWGLAWYPAAGRGARVFKSPGPLPREKTFLAGVARRAAGRVALFHLRRASNPRGLPLSRLRGRRHAQPFTDGAWTFAHNGSIPFPDQTARLLGRWRSRVKGNNDSEVLFWLLRRCLAESSSMPRALLNVRRLLRSVSKKTGGVRPHGGLNILLSDGRRLWAYTETPEGRRAASLCSPEWPYFQLAFLPAEDRLWVASEPVWSGAPWRPLRSGELLRAEIRRRGGGGGDGGGGVAWQRTRIVTV